MPALAEGYVLDTNVVSALRVRGRNPRVEEWAFSVAVEEQFITAFTVAEVERGVAVKERSDARQGEVLREWFEGRVLPAFAGRVLPFNLDAARLLANYPTPGQVPMDDALIAATAQASGMVVVTRNTTHFAPLGVRCLNPWLGA